MNTALRSGQQAALREASPRSLREYFPIPAFLRPLNAGPGHALLDFSPGPVHQPLIEVAGHKLFVNICFEDVFGSEFRKDSREAAILVNLTNDAWFGLSSAPHQHLQIARIAQSNSGLGSCAPPTPASRR